MIESLALGIQFCAVVVSKISPFPLCHPRTRMCIGCRRGGSGVSSESYDVLTEVERWGIFREKYRIIPQFQVFCGNPENSDTIFEKFISFLDSGTAYPQNSR